jgi:hypothetical protein
MNFCAERRRLLRHLPLLSLSLQLRLDRRLPSALFLDLSAFTLVVPD